jgi:hypothetical protein
LVAPGDKLHASMLLFESGSNGEQQAEPEQVPGVTCMVPWPEMLPPVGRYAVTPTVDAGHTMDPQVSVPMAYGSSPAAVAAAAAAAYNATATQQQDEASVLFHGQEVHGQTAPCVRMRTASFGTRHKHTNIQIDMIEAAHPHTSTTSVTPGARVCTPCIAPHLLRPPQPSPRCCHSCRC